MSEMVTLYGTTLPVEDAIGALRYARTVIAGKPMDAETLQGKKAFDLMHHKAEFKRAVLKGQVESGRWSTAQLQDIQAGGANSGVIDIALSERIKVVEVPIPPITKPPVISESKISIKQPTITTTPTTATEIRTDIGKADVTVQPPGTIYKVQTGTFTPKIGQSISDVFFEGSKVSEPIPTTQTYTVQQDYSTKVSTEKELKLLDKSIASDTNLILNTSPEGLRAARLTKPITTQLSDAYKSTGKGSEFYGVLRAGIVGADIVSSKTIEPVLDKLNVPSVVIETKPVEEIAMMGLFLSPVSSTTAQIERQLVQKSVAKVIGATKTTSADSSTTQAVYEVTKGSKSVKGFVVADSKAIINPKVDLLTAGGRISVSTTADDQAIITALKGKPIIRAVNFPSGKEVIKFGDDFSGVEIAKIVQKADVALSRGVGVTTSTKTGKTTFESVGISTRIEDYIAQIGGTASKGGITSSGGLFKIVDDDIVKTIYKVGGRFGGSAGGSSTGLSTINTKAIQSFVTKSINIPVTKPINILPPTSTGFTSRTSTSPITSVMKPITTPSIVSTINKVDTGVVDVIGKSSLFSLPKTKPSTTPVVSSIVKQKDIIIPGITISKVKETYTPPKIVTPTYTIPKITQTSFIQPQSFIQTPTSSLGSYTTPITSQGYSTLMKQPQMTSLSSVQKSISKTLMKQPQITGQISKLNSLNKSLLSQKSILKQTPIQKKMQRFMSIPRFPLPRIRIPKIPIIPYIPRKSQSFMSSKSGFGVYGRRQGKWSLIGMGKTSGQAVGIGKQWARKTLGVSFKIPKYTGLKIGGFRSKKEKGGTIFIEPKRKRIKKRGTSKEYSELVFWKGIKNPLTKKRKKKK